MRHTGPDDLHLIDSLLEQIRAFDGLTEKGPGRFYRKSQAFLHFHVHGDELFADVRLAPGPFTRLPATTAAQQRTLVAKIRAALK
jgi:hypothetical protein